MIEVNKKYKHKKTGNYYKVVLLDVINCTNAQDGQILVIYTNGQKLFAREKNEFIEKFVIDKE